MSEQQAIIHTTLGDITLKFFPDVAPNHVNNFIELPRKVFIMGRRSTESFPSSSSREGIPTPKALTAQNMGWGARLSPQSRI